jgi:hypothetical protein
LRNLRGLGGRLGSPQLNVYAEREYDLGLHRIQAATVHL